MIGTGSIQGLRENSWNTPILAIMFVVHLLDGNISFKGVTLQQPMIRKTPRNERPTMLREDNVFYAKRNLVDSIWKEARLEGIAVTFPETQEIFEGRSVSGLSVDDVLAINNLKHAWQYVFDTLDAPLDLEWLRGLNRKIGEGGVVRYAGDLRQGVVTIGGTDWIPSVPDASETSEMIDGLARIEDPIERATETLCALARAQMFNDGNKRTAQLAANKILIENGCGILAIKDSDKIGFLNELIGYYESADSTDLKDFLRSKAIDSPELAQPNLQETVAAVERSKGEQAVTRAARSASCER